MNLFSKLFRSRDKPRDYLSVHWPFLFGGTAAGRNVNERTSIFTAIVDRVVVLSKKEIVFELKCGLRLKERLVRA